MALNFGNDFGGDSLNNLPSPFSDQDLKDFEYTGAISTTVYTVPAGKKFYLTGLQCQATPNSLAVTLSRDLVRVLEAACSADGFSDNRNFATPLLFKAGEAIIMDGSGNHEATTIFGWVE